MNADFDDGLQLTWLMRYAWIEVMLRSDEEQDAIAARILELLDDDEARLASAESAKYSVEELKVIVQQRIQESVLQCERGLADIKAGRYQEFPEAFLKLGQQLGFAMPDSK